MLAELLSTLAQKNVNVSIMVGLNMPQKVKGSLVSY